MRRTLKDEFISATKTVVKAVKKKSTKPPVVKKTARKTTTASIVSLVEMIERHKGELRELYSKVDKLTLQAGRLIEVGRSVDIGNGRVAEYVDNYANTNVVFRPSAVRRFELNVRNKKKGE